MVGDFQEIEWLVKFMKNDLNWRKIKIFEFCGQIFLVVRKEQERSYFECFRKVDYINVGREFFLF